MSPNHKHEDLIWIKPKFCQLLGFQNNEWNKGMPTLTFCEATTWYTMKFKYIASARLGI